MENLRNQIMIDIKQGIVKSYYKYLMVFILAILTSIEFFNKVHAYIDKGMIDGQISYIDCIIYQFKGMKEYVPAFNNPFDVPVQFMLINLLLAFMIGNYPMKDLYGMGMQMLIRSKTKLSWWCEKCIWNVITVIAYYFTIYIALLLVSVFCGAQLSGNIHINVVNKLLGTNVTAIVGWQVVAMVIILPICTSIAISMMQMFLAFLLNPIISYIVVIMVYIFSAYYMKWYMVGNYLMFYRSSMLNPLGMSFWNSMWMDAAIFLFSSIIGYLHFRCIDIMEKG